MILVHAMIASAETWHYLNSSEPVTHQNIYLLDYHEQQINHDHLSMHNQPQARRLTDPDFDMERRTYNPRPYLPETPYKSDSSFSYQNQDPCHAFPDTQAPQPPSRPSFYNWTDSAQQPITRYRYREDASFSQPALNSNFGYQFRPLTKKEHSRIQNDLWRNTDQCYNTTNPNARYQQNSVFINGQRLEFRPQ
jgi:hypothetical protein